MKTTADFNIDPYGARNGKGIYFTRWISYYDAERFIEACRDEFAENYFNVPKPPPHFADQQRFLIALRTILSDDDKLKNTFKRFGEYIIERIYTWPAINEMAEYNDRVIAYDDYVCEQSGGTITHSVTHPNYIVKFLEWLPSNWSTYWKWVSSDSQNCGGYLRREYASLSESEWGDRYERFISEIVEPFLDVINERLDKLNQN